MTVDAVHQYADQLGIGAFKLRKLSWSMACRMEMASFSGVLDNSPSSSIKRDSNS